MTIRTDARAVRAFAAAVTLVAVGLTGFGPQVARAAVPEASGLATGALIEAATAKVAPTRVVAYTPGGTFSADTNLVSDSGAAAWLINGYLAANTPLPPIGAAFVKAERETGVNAIYLVAHAMLESGFGTSAIARTKYNLFGYHAYDRNPGLYATAYGSYADSVLQVARAIRKDYLTPGGSYWGGYPTLRGMNLAYATDPGWADKIAAIANRIIGSTATLRARGIRSVGVADGLAPSNLGGLARGSVTSAGSAVGAIALAGTMGSVTVRLSHAGALPGAISFAVRWTPVSVGETAMAAPHLAAPAWTAVRRNSTGSGVRLAVGVPSAPGTWRLEVRALDVGGGPLPATDDLSIPAQVVRVVAAREASVALSLAADGRLTAGMRVAGTKSIPAASSSGTPTALEIWFLPLDPSAAAVRLVSSPLARTLAPGATVSATVVPAALRAALSHGAGVVIARVAGDPGTIGGNVPAVGLLRPATGASGRASLAAVSVIDPRTATALAASAGVRATSAPAAERSGSPFAVASGRSPGVLAVSVDAAVMAAAADYLPGTPDASTAIGTAEAAGIAPSPAPVLTSPDLAVASAADTAAAATAATPKLSPTRKPAQPVNMIGQAAQGRPNPTTTAAGSAGPDASTASTAGTAGDPASVAPASAAPSAAAPSAAAPAAGSTAASSALPEQASILVRTLGAAGPDPAPDATILTPTASASVAASVANGRLSLAASGIGPGMRLVVVALVAPGSPIADPTSLVVAWIPVTAPPADSTPAPDATAAPAPDATPAPVVTSAPDATTGPTSVATPAPDAIPDPAASPVPLASSSPDSSVGSDPAAR